MDGYTQGLEWVPGGAKCDTLVCMFELGRWLGTRNVAWLLVVCAAVRSLAAQERVATAGRVLAVDGKPVAGATVMFVGSVPPLFDRFDPADYHEVKSDEKGRFKVRLLARGDYATWAVGLTNPDGSCWVSDLREVQPGTGFEIQLRGKQDVTRMKVSGLDGWKDVGPLRIELGLSTNTVRRQPVRVVDGVVTLPPRPDGLHVMVFVVNRDGELLFAESLNEARMLDGFVVPHPQVARVRVCGAAGNAIANAVIRMEADTRCWGERPNALGGHRSLSEWRVVGKTDDAGELRVSVPTRREGSSYPHGFSMMVASKRGYRASLSGFYGGVVIDGNASASWPEDRVLPFTLEKAATWSGRLVGRDGLPAQNLPVEVSAQMLLPMDRGGFRQYATAFRSATDVDGSFCFEQLPKEFAEVLFHVGMPRSADGVRERAPAFRKVDLKQPLLLDLRTLPKLDLHVLDLNGLPARNAHVLLLPVPIGERKLDASTHIVRLDNAGKARVPVQPGRWQVVATDRFGLHWTVVDVTKDQSVAIRLAELQVLRGTVLKDPATRRSRIKFGINMQHVGFGGVMNEGIVPAIGAPLNRWLLGGTEIGEDGAVAFRFASVERTQLGAFAKAASKSAEFLLMPGSGLEIDLRSK